MAEKNLGYVELEWTCPSCNTRNPGSAAKCMQCAAPMPEEAKFDKAVEEKLITDEQQIAAASLARYLLRLLWHAQPIDLANNASSAPRRWPKARRARSARC